ncbi:MAG TPA: TetR/AcrR family transcriptional regulator [Acidobacteriota bacterium]|nr:TetR/AcrR family transcriptional regulator [Acidobacteriota bacterium]
MKNRKPRQRDADATRAALLNAARQLFADRGFDGTRTQLIADRAGVNKAMISYYFKGKKGLYQTLLIEDLQAAQNQLAAADSPGTPPAERLSRFLMTLSASLTHNPGMVRILVREQMGGSRNLEPRVWKQLFNFFKSVREILQDGMECGSFRKIDPHALHLSLVGGLIYYLLTEPARETYAKAGDLPPTPSWNDYVKIQRDLFLRALTPDKQIESTSRRKKK